MFPSSSQALTDIPNYERKINWFDEAGKTALYWSVIKKDLNLMQSLILANADINQAGTANGVMPIEAAVTNDFKDGYCLLLEIGAVLPEPLHRSADFVADTQQFHERRQRDLEQAIQEFQPKNEALRLNFFFFSAFPSKVCGLNNLTDLSLAYNNLLEFPPDVAKLTNLLNLDVSNNLITSLPPEINKLKELKTLVVSHNFLTAFPKIQDLNQLTNLNLSHNQIPTIHKTIAQLFRLLKCDFSYNLIEKLPKYLAELSGIDYLNVSHNCIHRMKEFPFHLLNSLRVLNISYNNIREMPYDNVMSAGIVSKLIFKNNMLPTQQYRIMRCFYQREKRLNLSSLGLKEVPTEIRHLTFLTELDLSLNQLTVLPPELGNLTDLRAINISYNLIQAIPLYFHRFSKLEYLNIDDLSLSDPPKSVTDGGWKAIQEYYEDLLDGEPCYRTKLMLVGQENVGKTTLLHAMRQLQKKQRGKRNNISTDGIDIESWNIKTSDKRQLTFSAWDFAGQEIYYATHSFFLSSKAIYLIIWDLRYPAEDARVGFWLNSVESRASNAPVILVGTHYDDPMFQNDHGQKVTEVLTAVSEKYLQRHPNIRKVLAVSNTEYDGIEDLMGILENTALSMPNIMDKLPRIYQNLEDLIFKEKDLCTPPAITWDQFAHMASKVNFKDEEHLMRATEFLNNLGSLVFFGDITSKDGLVVLDPQWLTSMFASIITTSHSYTQKGTLQKSVLGQIWRAPRYPPSLHGALIKLLKDFEIIYELPPAPDTNDLVYLIPSLLPDERPHVDLLWPTFDATAVDTEFNRSYTIEFVPNGLFSRLMVRLLHFLDKPIKYWRTGIMGERGNARCFVELIDVSIHFTTRGEGSAEFLRVITEIVDTLVTDFFKVRICSVYIRCPHCLALRRPEPYQFDLCDCEQVAAMGNVRMIDCLAEEPFPIRLDRIVPDIAMADFDGSQVNYKDIVIERTLGKGSFGVIYLAKWKGETVAVKQLKVESDMALEAYAEFRKEVWLMSGLDHPCIVNLLGYCTNPLVMVMECVSGGDLYGLIHNPDITIDWHVRMKIALDMAYGLEYMHGINPPLLHRDLKSPNVLVMKFEDGADVIAKVADFGLSSRLFVDTLQNRAVENPTWCAPEVMVRKVYSEAADVYPYGVMLWELLTREHPYDNYRFQYQLEDDVLRGVRPEIPSTGCWPDYAELMAACWDPEPSKRPDFPTIVKRLLKMIETEIGLEKFRFALDPAAVLGRRATPATPEARRTSNPQVERSLQLQGELLKEVDTKMKINCVMGQQNQVWCGTSDGFILVFSAISGMYYSTYVSPRGCVNCLIPTDMEGRIWSGGIDSVGIWKLEDKGIAREEAYRSEILSGLANITVTSTDKRKFKKGPARWVVLCRDGNLKHYANQGDTRLLGEVHLKDAVVEVIKGKGKGKCRLFVASAGDYVVSLQTSTENELNAWADAISAMTASLSSYPSNLEMVKKLPTGAEQIRSMSACNEQILLGFTNSSEIRVVDGMLRSKPSISFAESLSGRVTVNNILVTVASIWISCNNQILRIHPRTHAVQSVLQEKHREDITHLCVTETELWSSAAKEVCCWSLKNGGFLQSIQCTEEIHCMLKVGDRVWLGGNPSILVYDSTQKKLMSTLSGHRSPIKGMALVTGPRLWSISEDGKVCVWN